MYAWRSDGSQVKGFPASTGSYIWSSPAICDIDHDGRQEILAGSWDGNVHSWRSDGTVTSGFPLKTGGRIFSTPAAGDTDGDGNEEIAVGSWDKSVYLWKYPANQGTEATPPGWPMHGNDIRHTRSVEGRFSIPARRKVDDDAAPGQGRVEVIESFLVPKEPAHRDVVLLSCKAGDASLIESMTLYYRPDWEREWHPVPMVLSAGSLIGIFQPLNGGARVDYYAEALSHEQEMTRLPKSGYLSYRVKSGWGDLGGLKYPLRSLIRRIGRP